MEKRLAILLNVLIFVSIILTGHIHAQSSEVDSLLNLLKVSKEDTAALNILINLSSSSQQSGDYKTSKTYADRALALADKLSGNPEEQKNTDYINKCKNYKASALNWIGVFYHTVEANDSAALVSYNRALKLAEETGDKETTHASYQGMAEIYLFRGDYAEALKYCMMDLKIEEELIESSRALKDVAFRDAAKRNMALTQTWIAVIYNVEGNYVYALKNVLSSLKIYEELGNKGGIADCYGIMGNIYDAQGNYVEAMKNYNSALKIDKEVGIKQGMAAAYKAIGSDYFNLGNYKEAMNNALEALKINEEIGDKRSMAGCYDDIGKIYRKQDNYTEALKKHMVALKLYEETNDNLDMPSSYKNIGDVYSRMGNYKDALDWLNKAQKAAKDLKNNEELKEIYTSLSKLYERSGDHKNALSHQRLYQELNDSLFNEKISRQMVEMRIIYETEEKDNEIRLKEEEVKKQTFVKYAAISFAALVLLTALVFINSMRIRNRSAQILQRNEIRQKMSRDLHDEIGSGLTSISMICEQAKMKLNKDYSSLSMDSNALNEYSALNKQYYEKIRVQSRSVNEKLREVIWATNPDNDNLEALISYIRNYVSKFFEDASMTYLLNLPEDSPKVNLKADVSRNLIFVLKEALNNCVKHSKSQSVEISFMLAENPILSKSVRTSYNYKLVIDDQGIGIDYAQIPIDHNGLGNMRKRIESIKGKFEIITQPGKGTKVEISGSLT